MIVSRPTIQGAGRLRRIASSPDGRVLAVASAFPLLTQPPARAAYAGQRLHDRLSLHHRGESTPFAWTDALRLPIADISFHPRDPVVAIGAGSYDGGYCFEGDLILWDWVTDRVWRPFSQTPEVARCAFVDNGERLKLLVRPWDEGWAGAQVELDPFEQFYPLTIPYAPGAPDAPPNAQIFADQCLTSEDAGFVPVDPAAIERTVSAWFGVSSTVRRGAIWDIAWLDDQRLAVVHDDCLLEVHDLATGGMRRFEGDGFGGAILNTTPPIVHVTPAGHGLGPQPRSRLMAFADDELTELRTFDGLYDFSSSSRGQVLARLNKSHGYGPLSDLLIDPVAGKALELDLGHYDSFNHYIGVDGAPDLYFLQGTPPSSHADKQMCRLGRGGAVERLWPLLRADGGHASHAMECKGCFVDDALGAGLIVAGRHYDPNPSKAATGFIYRKPLDADRELWRHVTRGAASAIVAAPTLGVVAAAFLDGQLWVINAETGAILASGPVTVGGVPTVIFCMDARGDALAVGTFDGQIAVLSLRTMTAGTSTGLDLA